MALQRWPDTHCGSCASALRQHKQRFPSDQRRLPIPKVADQLKRKEMKTLSTTMNDKWDFSTWFVVTSPVLGVVFGFLSLVLFAR